MMNIPKSNAGAKRLVAVEFPGDKQGQEAAEKEAAARLFDDATRKALRQEEDAAKKELLEREKENFTKIFALKCHNGWMKICNNSALIVSMWLDGRLGRPYERKDDKGYGARAKYGVVSIAPGQVGDFVQRLARAGIPLTYDGEMILEFDLGERISQEEMVRMLHEDELMIDRVNQIVMTKSVMPNLRAEVKLLLKYVHTQVRNQKDTVKDIFLNDVERQAVDMNRAMIATARGRVKMEECLEQAGWFAEEMYENATTMSDLGLITAKQYKDFVDLIKKVENEQAREMKRVAIERTEKKIEKSKRKVEND